MVHKTEKTKPDEMERKLREMDKEQDQYLKSLEDDMKRQEEDFKQTVREAEATAIGIYEGVRGAGETAIEVGKKVKKGVEVAKVRFGEFKAGAEEVARKIKGVKVRPRWYQREPIRIAVSPEIAKKREREEKQFMRIGE